MKNLIIYNTKTGSTKEYASSIAARTNADVISFKEMKLNKLKEYDTILFLSYVRSYSIIGIEKFLNFYYDLEDKNLLVGFVGMSPRSQEVRNLTIITNGLDDYHLRLYQLMGSVDINKLGFLEKRLFKFSIQRAIAQSGGRGAQTAEAEKMLKYPRHVNDQMGMDKIVSVMQQLEKEKK